MNNLVVRHVKLLLAGVPEPMFFPVTAKESDEIYDALAGDAPFVAFQTTEETTVVVAGAYVQVANFLFDLGDFERELQTDDIRIYLRGRDQPFKSAVEGQSEDLTNAIDAFLMYDDTSAFFGFVDEDGEDILVRFDQVMCAVVPHGSIYLLDDTSEP